MGSGGEREKLVDAITQQLIQSFQRRLCKAHLDRVRDLKAPSEKLIYLYLLLAQPQSFTTIRRAMALNRRTVNQALVRLMKLGHIHLDDRYLYWTTEPAAER